ncbi:MBL fold metallo-hydrolase [soil metagenome]
MRVSSLVTDDRDVLLTNDVVQIRQISVSSMDNNVYLVTCAKTGAQALIDAADDPERVERLIEGAGTGGLNALITTHRHWDHHRALAQVATSTEAHTYAGAADADHLPLAPDTVLEHDDSVLIGHLRLSVISLRGHTPGSIAVALLDSGPDGAALLFTGDSLFPGGPGKTDSHEDFTSLMDDLTHRVFGEYSDSALVLPGHGDGTSLGEERGQLEQWRQRGW